MMLYLDDDSVARHLVGALRKAGHSVVLPRDAVLASAIDSRHMRHAVRNRLVLLTRNYAHFTALHELVLACGGRHSGILLIRFDNNPKTDMKVKDVLTAIRNLDRTGISLTNQILALNQWQ